MEIKRIRIEGFEMPKLVRVDKVLTYKAETTDGKKTTVVTNGKWKIGDVVDAIVEGLTK